MYVLNICVWANKNNQIPFILSTHQLIVEELLFHLLPCCYQAPYYHAERNPGESLAH